MTKPSLRVLMIAPGLQILGGQAIQADRLLTALRKEPSLQIDFQAIGPLLPEPFCLLQRIPLIRTGIGLLAFAIQVLVRGSRYDIFHVFTSSNTGYALWALPSLAIARLYGKKIVLNYRDGRAEQHLRNWKIAVPTIARMDAVVTPSNYLVDVFSRYGLRAEAIVNVVFAEHFPYRQRSQIQPVFLHNRSFEELYNVPCTLRAFQIVQRRHPEARLILANDGPLRSQLERLITELGLDNVEMVGRVPNERMAELIDSADVYLTSPDLDCMPGSLLECFASGLPVVATASGGIPYIAQNEQNALLVPPGDHEAMADAALRLLADHLLVERLTANARASCAQYAEGPVRDGWMTLYRRLAGGDHPRQRGKSAERGN
jgi:glycosyltransferase involved in cell wall biosynthesis